jgi:flavin reductase (DIM6/NTAB) family NADH-FMN oxidoreductase RutF
VVDRLSSEASEVEAAFDALLASLDFPMFIVTTAAVDDGERSGCLLGFATQSSIDPRRFLACISVENHTARVAARADHLAVHVVPRDRIELAVLFGHETGDHVDKFTECDWTPGAGGVPLLDACPARMVGRVLDRHPLGDHTGYLLEPIVAELRAPAPGDYVRFQDVKDLDPGHPA